MFVFVFYIKPNEEKANRENPANRDPTYTAHTHRHAYIHTLTHTHTDTLRQGKANRNFGTCVQHQREIRLN